ncbi:polysaccharide deacetylase family protein [Streptococcus alactolyticus]|jgi:peptidoglycan/xylan/chitin deacetylase (PgdA/CDA1 family)|uniref:Polysaccharide deacetylase family protein n=1 Tax=Streptococcus alactolyticus TaxID=29389 RepID=A0ABY7M1X6_STRAY|nr:polysaccharide deacetylase family protein [Streptococcus alactolyticus]MDE2587456.1 polysaccharide deacetylase family protein [Lactobacillales bacterium]MCI6903881.1 polysaccharide deacetylase family protein [Streptococcus alactolyticus]MDD7361301.1 polysaccharide deacetylase family protein [Streptococcus alactolyticus]MDY5186628.1 polysaccharide deacetylase family protein [Streptococcus alactolyticus]WBB07079.1 polysaccharide deacetylase family protein [Streptococcus alactolyticus]
MEKRSHRHRRQKKKPTVLIWFFLAFACVIAGVAIFFIAKPNHATKQAQDVIKQESTVIAVSSTSSSTTSQESSEVDWVKQDTAIHFPILMYHAIHVMAPEESANANLIVDPTTFESHIQRLSNEGYYFLTPEEVHKVLTENVLPNGNQKIIWLTFDDSLWDFYDNAYPILQKYQVKATNNVITSTVGSQANLSLDEMLEMKNNGMSFQDHTVTHPDLSATDSSTQTTEMKDSKQYLDDSLNQDTIAIAYPAGRYSDTTLQIAENLDYKLGVTTNEGLASADNGLLSLNRIRILPTTTADSIMATIN